MGTGSQARRGIGPAWVAWALGALVALAVFASALADEEAWPLRVQTVQQVPGGAGTVGIGVALVNRSGELVEVVDLQVPGVGSRGYTGASAGGSVAVAPGASGRILLRVPCASVRQEFTRLDARLLVGGRETRQAIPLDRVLRIRC